ncbi:MAG: twin-arginine translocation signal domain-containing protein [Rubrobacter sp.]|nr:twin-arginine translocation signal domain-containing protein [Rubrobacter sp.]MDQ3860366.1 twin-arginine translocation signal domain-containing protein [Actinomycetota bacterium]
MVETRKTVGEMSRRDFLRLGLAGVAGATLVLVTGCAGEEDDEDDEDDGRRRRRRRRR